MSDPDARLKALFALDEPPAHDPAFVLDTIRRMQRRRFWLEAAAHAPWAIAASAILWLLTPWLERVGHPAAMLLSGLVPAAGLAATAFILASPRSRFL